MFFGKHEPPLHGQKRKDFMDGRGSIAVLLKVKLQGDFQLNTQEVKWLYGPNDMLSYKNSCTILWPTNYFLISDFKAHPKCFPHDCAPWAHPYSVIFFAEDTKNNVKIACNLFLQFIAVPGFYRFSYTLHQTYRKSRDKKKIGTSRRPFCCYNVNTSESHCTLRFMMCECDTTLWNTLKLEQLITAAHFAVGGIQTQLMSGLHMSLAQNLNQNDVISPLKGMFQQSSEIINKKCVIKHYFTVGWFVC